MPTDCLFVLSSIIYGLSVFAQLFSMTWEDEKIRLISSAASQAFFVTSSLLIKRLKRRRYSNTAEVSTNIDYYPSSLPPTIVMNNTPAQPNFTTV